MAHNEEKGISTYSTTIPAIDQAVEKIKENNTPVDDLMFFELVNLAGLAPGEYQKLEPEEEKRRWDLLFSLPKDDLPIGNKST